MTSNEGSSLAESAIGSSDDAQVREGIAALSDAELRELVKLAFFWGIHPAGFYEWRTSTRS
ncbi:MAG: hypothetical protein LBV34_20885 [Nocardiopsaceae bacterium]|jgi:hypothetical protein|nr:hypothetical protein [Nocardiopsaceae bacterium]